VLIPSYSLHLLRSASQTMDETYRAKPPPPQFDLAHAIETQNPDVQDSPPSPSVSRKKTKMTVMTERRLPEARCSPPMRSAEERPVIEVKIPVVRLAKAWPSAQKSQSDVPDIFDLPTVPQLIPLPAKPSPSLNTSAPQRRTVKLGPWTFTRPHPLLWVSLMLGVIALVLQVPKGRLPTITGRHRALRVGPCLSIRRRWL